MINHLNWKNLKPDVITTSYIFRKWFKISIVISHKVTAFMTVTLISINILVWFWRSSDGVLKIIKIENIGWGPDDLQWNHDNSICLMCTKSLPSRPVLHLWGLKLNLTGICFVLNWNNDSTLSCIDLMLTLDKYLIKLRLTLFLSVVDMDSNFFGNTRIVCSTSTKTGRTGGRRH